MTDYKDAQLRQIAADRDSARLRAPGDDVRVERPMLNPQTAEDGLRPEYIAMMRAHVDEDGQLSHRNGIDLLAEVERLRRIIAGPQITPPHP